jgi:hypothetical protein|eukprot:COSAG06_NODE_9057_length_2000_cov_8.463440_3_plen_243_part_00
MKKGETATEIFFVRSGIVETTEKDPTLGGDDDYKVSAIVEKGDCFGDEVVFAHDDTRMKFARCRTDVELLVLKKADLLEILGEGEDSRKMEKTVQKQSALLSSFPRSCYRGPPKLRVRAPRQSRAGTTALRLRQRSAVAALSTRTTTTSWTSMSGAEIHHLRSHTAGSLRQHALTHSLARPRRLTRAAGFTLLPSATCTAPGSMNCASGSRRSWCSGAQQPHRSTNTGRSCTVGAHCRCSLR